MYKVVKLTEDTNPINNFTIGKIKSIEIIGDTDSSDDVNINLLRKVRYQTPDKEYIDTIPAEGTTVKCAAFYTLPETEDHYAYVEGTPTHVDVPFADAGLELYSTETSSVITGFKNGYYDLTFEDIVDPAKRNWTLTHFKYVDGVKTTIKQYTASTDADAIPEELTLKYSYNTSSQDGYVDTIVLALTTEADVKQTVADTYCSDSVLTTVGWTTHDEEVEIEILDTTITSETMATGRTIIDLNSSFYANFNDKFVFDGDIETLRKLNIFIYIES